jgi:hypothetical protein
MNIYKRIPIILTALQLMIIVFTIIACQSQEITNGRLSATEIAFLTSDFELLYRIKELPDQFVDLLPSEIADPGEPFNAGCSIDPSLPYFQLSWAGKSKEIGFILYKEGGFGPIQRLVIFELGSNETAEIVEFFVPNYVSHMKMLKETVRSSKPINLKKLN